MFFLGQSIDQKARRDGREARGNEERGKREDCEREQRGAREIERETKRQFEEKEGLRDPPPFIRISRSDPACSHCFFKSSGWSSSIKICTSL